MKSITKVALALVAFALMSGNQLFAQKFGYINSQDLINIMPERDTVQNKLNAYSTELSETLEMIQVEFNNKLNDYQKGQATMTATVKQLKEKELQDLQARFEEFQQNAQQEMQKMQQELMSPVIAKATIAIKAVCKAGGYIAVFDISSGALAYHDEKAMTDILPMVKKELKIAETDKPSAGTAAAPKK